MDGGPSLGSRPSVPKTRMRRRRAESRAHYKRNERWKSTPGSMSEAISRLPDKGRYCFCMESYPDSHEENRASGLLVVAEVIGAACTCG
jgi:hypothetical protein